MLEKCSLNSAKATQFSEMQLQVSEMEAKGFTSRLRQQKLAKAAQRV
jgi:hypothetical protein